MDLDGTLVVGNTFWLWISLLLTRRWSLRDLPMKVAILRAIADRALKRSDHAALKFAAQSAWRRSTPADQKRRAWSLSVERAAVSLPCRRARAHRAVLRCRAPVLLATAAPAEYAEPLAERLGLDGCIATAFSEADWTHNLGAAKRDSVLARLASLGLAERQMVIVTDHRDDLP